MKIACTRPYWPFGGPSVGPGPSPTKRRCCPLIVSPITPDPSPSAPPTPSEQRHVSTVHPPPQLSACRRRWLSPFFTTSTVPTFLLLLLLVLSLTSLVHGQDSFYFKVKPKNHDVEEGKPVRLRCQVSDNLHIQYRWTLNNEPVKLDTRRIQDSSDLHIRKADAELDSGKFRCVATNKSTGYSLQSEAAVINVFWLSPKVSVELAEPSRLENVVLGGPLELRCATSASPPVRPGQIIWYMNFQRLKVKTAQQIGIQLLKSGNLRIPKTKTGNVGVYRCLVLHPAGRIMSTSPFPLTFGADNKYNSSNKPEHFIKYVKRGDEMKLHCLPFNYSQGRMHFMQWSFRQSLDPNAKTVDFRSDTKCTSTRRVCVLPLKDKYALLRRRVRKRSDTGFYKCSAMPWQSKPFVVEVRLATNPRLPPTNLYPPSRPDSPLVVVKGKDLTVRLYQDLTAISKASVVPDPAPKYRWFTPGGTEVPEYSSLSRQRIYKLNDRNLHIKNAREEDSGVYSLWISNLAGDQKINVSLVVAFPPKFSLSRMGDVRAEENKDTKFRCNVESMAQFPVARVVWFKDKRRIPLLSHPRLLLARPIPQATSRLIEDQRQGTLTIRSVAVSDEGSYHCAVDTQRLRPNLFSSHAFQLRVIRTLKILNPVKKQFLQRNQEARVACMAQGEGRLSFQWLRNHQVVPPMRARADMWAIKGNLFLPKVTDSQAGNYTCIVSNRQGHVNHTIQVIVGERPTIHSISSNLTVPEGRSVTLNCEATGDPRPTISWIKKLGTGPNSVVESITKDRYAVMSPEDRRVMLPNGSLLIRRAVLSDAAYYWCVAGNTYAMNSEKEVYLRVLAQSTWKESGRDSSWGMTKTVIIVVGCAVAYLALIIGLTIYCSVRMLRNRQKRAAWAVAKMEVGAPAPGSHENGRLMAMPNGESQGLMSAPDGGPGPGHGDSRSHFSSASAYTRSLRAGTPNGSLQDRASTYPRHQLVTLGMLGKGEFGDVFLARAHNIREGENESLVVIKSHHNGRSDTLDFEFHQQMDMFAKLDHDFVVKLLGVCREMEPEFMILEYCEWGDLKQFLKAMRQSDKENNERNVKIPPLTASQKVTMCSQVALGMEHLSNYRYIHKDLAARNVLLTSTLDLKIANLGLCQDVYAGEYFPMRNKRLPLRWLPAEVILEDAYSTKSDVWAFGILVYEVFTLGDIPHRRLTDLQVINAAESHFLMPELPAQCPAELASLLRQCWSDKPRERPSFNDISVIIGELTVDSDI